MHVRVKFEVHVFINFVHVVMDFKDEDKAVQVAIGLRNKHFNPVVKIITENISSEEISF